MLQNLIFINIPLLLVITMINTIILINMPYLLTLNDYPVPLHFTAIIAILFALGN